MVPDAVQDAGQGPHASPAEPPDFLALLPVPLLLNSVLPLLSAPDVVRLAACCRHLKEGAFADDVWRPRCEARGWALQFRGMGWQECYTARRQTLCVECGEASRYVFLLLSCRLCEKCEHASPRYSLVTALEAAERYGVPYAALGGVPYHEACNTRFYLRTTVESMAKPLGGGLRGAGAGADEDESEEEEAEDQRNGERADEPMGPEAEAGDRAQLQQQQRQDDASSGAEDEDGGAAGDAAAQRRAAEKAERKAAKKAAKEAQRAKRQGKATPPMAAPPRPSYGKIVTGTSPPTGKSRGGGGAGVGRAGRGAAGPFGRSPPGCRAAGPLLVQDDGDGQALPLEGQAVAGGGRRRGGGRAAAGGGRAGAAAGAAASGPSRTVKLKSGWAAEREALMAAWGQFGISGLVLAS
ncbi:hypothetical protein HXX76_009262 [Chlamydomonas incerta]|uniref:F-box domain-containing protein n=1 Tax=Chlamydomonas incerta TaxID=51695 RepID=A0A835T549_CHLIN|nr:hypothetical protein HXX76_009262 [Chlamydomonas incerta]|eukprot:KAG2431766.1 hypothetical protein HXX76_009262 [Chlamydomonas incerta]